MKLRFDDFELDLTSGELWRVGRPIDLPPQPARLLTILASEGGRLVGREELRTRIWGESFLDWESGLHQSIRKIRVALGDSAAAPRYIETVPRRGYRFIGKALPAARPARTSVRNSMALAAILFSLLGGILLSVFAGQSPNPERENPERENEEAARLYAEALYFLEQRRGEEAEERLEQAAALDPTWSAPWSALAEVELARPRPDRVDRARRHLEGALSRNREDLRAWRQLARLRLWQDWDWIGARSALDQALEIDARDAEIWQLVAALETVEGHEGRALAAARRALNLDPVSTALRVDLGWTFYYFGRAREALAECERSLALQPANPSARQCVVQASWLLGRQEVDGRESSADYFRQQLELLEQSPGCATRPSAALPLLVLGRNAEAMDALLAGLDGEKGWALPFAHIDPLLEPLRSHADFPRIGRALGLTGSRTPGSIASARAERPRSR